MSAIKKAVRKVVTKSSSLTSSSRTSSRDAKQPRSSLSNGRHSLSNQSPSSSSSAELPPQPSDHISHSNGTHYRSRNLSFTELKVERREERQTRDEAEANARRLKHIRLHEQDPLRDNYGDLPLNMSTHHRERHLDDICSLSSMDSGANVTLRARVHHIRPLGSRIVFLVLRHQLHTIQAVLTEEDDRISHNMVRWAEGLNRESIVLVHGILQHPPDQQESVKSTSIHHLEIKVEKLFVIAAPTSTLPFQVDNVSKPAGVEGSHVSDKTRFNNRVLDLRSPLSQAVFRIRSGVCELFREVMLRQKFVEIQSSKFQGSSTESGAAVFKVDYFRRPAFLAQSPQLAKQMCIAADMERVFEIGPVFRAENSNTHRHLTEFTGLDLEMAFDVHYHEVIDVIDHTLLSVFRGLQEKFHDEIAVVKLQHPHEDLLLLDRTLRLKFSDGIEMLRESGWREEDGSEPSEWDDLSTRAEQRLGQLVREKYHTDYYILDKFPLAVRPFYTMPDPLDNKLSNSFDIFLRGEEILSGGQRIHHAPLLEQRMIDLDVDLDGMKDYLDGFRWGCAPHGGGGVGLERVVMLFLNLGDVRWASLFPRDPKSFPMNGQDLAEASMSAANALVLHGPEAKTFSPGHPHGDIPPLENLIAKYGDATNTSWTDPAWTVWRDTSTGAAVGYIPQGDYAVIFGNPLCDPKQIPRVVKAFLTHLDLESLKPVWCCVDKETEHYLARELGWSAVIASAEERLNPIEADPSTNDKTVRRKVHRAEREGVKVVEVDGRMDETVRQRIEERCQDWAAARKGTQIHLTGVRPFDDMIHRKYFYATDKDGQICALVVLAQLSPKHGFQIKWALEFPGAPLGAIEYILTFVIKKLGDAGVRNATFGAGATGTLQRVDNIGGLRVKTLEKTYNGLSHTFNLLNKGDFRSKFGVEHDPLYICYPKGGLGFRGIEAIMTMLQKPK
ncbi:hypothetical protein NLI96_g3934 [Meripilus lineatus]|uniref:Aspartate--tRNA ligase, cytoplasmic n=1 Tax=Meripilus lineatus TaxID=2056292 RepID=A0AAD5YF89_9APHY|nr:hypothetical protein NLI96_g3934 [Physisporinus lineatus]